MGGAGGARRGVGAGARDGGRRMAVLGVDVGGTFTDAVLIADGELRTAKVRTSERQEESVLAAAAEIGGEQPERFTHGTTVATNALLERKGARTAFVSTAGFEHLLHLRRQDLAHLSTGSAPRGPSRSCRSSAASACASGSARTACSSRSTSTRCPSSTPRRSRSAPSSRSAIRAMSAPSRPSFGVACPTRTSSPRTRSRPSSASTSAPRRRQRTHTSAR